MPDYNFLLINKEGPKTPHILVLTMNQRTGKFTWSYHAMSGNAKAPKPEAEGIEVRYANGGRQYDLYVRSGQFGTLTLDSKSINTLIPGDTGVFKSFTGGEAAATFKNRT